MAADLNNSQTIQNLMWAFAGECQAQSRYTIAAAKAQSQNLYVINAVFQFTASQEKEHSTVFYNYLQSMSGKTIPVKGGYPVDLEPTVAQLLRASQHNEYEEHMPLYSDFAKTAESEGFTNIAASFRMIGDIEKTHGDRFGMFAELLEQNKLFVSDVETKWMCLNCGHVHNGKEAPQSCPVCHHNQGFFIRMEMAPYTTV